MSLWLPRPAPVPRDPSTLITVPPDNKTWAAMRQELGERALQELMAETRHPKARIRDRCLLAVIDSQLRRFLP